MDYQQVRESIINGSVVFFAPHTVLGRFIPLIGGGGVSHCGITTWIRDSRGVKRLMLIESTVGGARLVNLSSYSNRKMIVVQPGLDWSSIEAYALDKTGFVPYAYTDFIWIALRERLVKLRLYWLARKLPNALGEVCSELVADVLIASKKFNLYSTLLSPGDVLAFLRARALPEIEISPA